MEKEKLQNTIEVYKTHKQRRWNKQNTRNNNRYYFNLLLDFIGDRQFDHETVEAFFNSLQEHGYAESNRRQAETAILAFASWLYRSGHTSKDFGEGIERTEIHRKPHVLPDTSEVIKRIDEATEPGEFDNKLTRFSKMEHRICLKFIVVACGGRNHETAMIEKKDVSISGRQILIKHGKTGERIVGIPEVPWLIEELERRVNGRSVEELDVLKGPHFDKTNKDRLFIVSETKMEETMRKVGQLVGFPMVVHDLRRIFARDMKKNRADIDDIRIAMGHKDIKTTLAYLYDDPSDIQRIINEYTTEAKRHMPNGKKLEKARHDLEKMVWVEKWELQPDGKVFAVFQPKQFSTSQP